MHSSPVRSSHCRFSNFMRSTDRRRKSTWTFLVVGVLCVCGSLGANSALAEVHVVVGAGAASAPRSDQFEYAVAAAVERDESAGNTALGLFQAAYVSSALKLLLSVSFIAFSASVKACSGS